MSHFRFIEKNRDVNSILQEVLDSPEDWGVAGTIKGAAGDLKPYGFLPLMMAVIRSKDDDPKNAIRSIPLQLRRFYIQAYQSFLFNKTLSLANEFEENLFEPEIDDVCFDKNSVLGKFENIPEQKLAVPLVGHSYYKKSRFDYYIKKILEEELLTPKDFFIKDFQELSVEGGFRNASINYDNFSIDKDLVKFQLSRGSYATIVLREILKPANPLDCGF